MGTLTLSQSQPLTRLLHILKDYGFLQQMRYQKKYILGHMAVKLGESAMKSINNNVVSIAIPYMTILAAQMGESIALEVLSGKEIYLPHHVEDQKHIPFSFNIAQRVPIYVAMGQKRSLLFAVLNS